MIGTLERHQFPKAEFYRLGLSLKLYHNTLEEIKHDKRDAAEPCFSECLAHWLRKVDNVDNPNWEMLILALREMGGVEDVADGIESESEFSVLSLVIH